MTDSKNTSGEVQVAESNASTTSTDRPLAQMRVADLQSLASELGVKGAARMRKSQLIDAIAQARGGSQTTEESAVDAADGEKGVAEKAGAPKSDERKQHDDQSATKAQSNASAETRDDSAASDTAEAEDAAGNGDKATGGQRNRSRSQQRKRGDQGRGEQHRDDQANGEDDSPKTLDDIVLPPARDEDGDEPAHDAQQEQSSGRKRNRNRNRNKTGDDSNNRNGAEQKNAGNNKRDRKRRDDVDPEIAPDDVLLPIAGILDVLDNYAFVRTSGYLAGQNDVYVSLGQVKKYNLRKGDAIVGAIRQPREGEYQSGRQKYNALVRIDSVNGEAPDANADRIDFETLTALYPTERITLETTGGHAAQRMIDLFAPIGKGTRGLIIAPPKSGKSILLERIANAIAENNPDTHLMLVLVDERPEEVTRLERTIHGEVISSTFDMPAENHTTIAELAIERAKRLVELGLDVVVLLDSITQLGRAYNLSAPTTGRIIDGGVDASALYPPKRFFGAARNVENGGSLTILATAMVETGSRADEVILEEFAGTANMELRLSRKIADKRIFPAIDIQQSSTLHEDQLLSPNEVDATWKVRRALGENAQLSLEAVLERIDSTNTNQEFLSSVSNRPITPVSAR